MKTAIVTGANGFLGSWLVNELVSHDVQVYAIVKDENEDISSIKTLNKTQIIYCDLDHLPKLKGLISVEHIDVFYHFAWAGTSGDGRANYELQLNNVKCSCDAIVTAKKLNCTKLVFAGSIMEYECMQYLPKDGICPGLNYLYSEAKQTADFMLKTLAVNLNIEYCTAIISNIYGEGERSARFVNLMLKKLLRHETLDLTSGTQLYDFIYVTDAVRALYLVGEKGKTLNSYYIGNSKVFPLRDFVIQMRDCVDTQLTLNFGKISYDGPVLTYTEFDITKVQNELTFTPYVSFVEGIKKTIAWLEEDNKK